MSEQQGDQGCAGFVAWIALCVILGFLIAHTLKRLDRHEAQISDLQRRTSQLESQK